MNPSNLLILSTSPLSQTEKKPRETASLTYRHRLLYRRRLRRHTGKERDNETGLYYFGARYLDSKTSRWLSGDPAMADYVPSAPVDDEARKHNKNLPGQGGVFNYVNLHVYHYAGNNPMKYVDPNGRIAIPLPLVIAWAVKWGIPTILAVLTTKALNDTIEYFENLPPVQAKPNSEETKEHTPDQEAAIDLAKGAKHTGVSPEDAETLVEWGNEVGLTPPSHGPETHPDRKQPSSQNPHIHVGPVDHIPVGP